MSEATISIRDLRKELGLTLAGLAERVGIGSVGHMSDIERGVPCSVKVALAIEALSAGRIPAGTINADVAAVEARLSRNGNLSDHDTPDTAAPQHGASGKADAVSSQVSA